MSAIEIHSKIESVQKLPESETPIDLSMLDTWSDLEDEQKLFLCAYFQTYPKRIAARMQSGISGYRLNEWIKKDNPFKMAFAEIEELHKENLSAIHYESAYTDSRTRKDVLKGIGARGYDNKENTKTTNILNIGEKSLPELLKDLNQ